MPRVKVGDINMYYDTRGEGFPLVLIMGFMGNADCWDPLYFLPRLSEHFKVITFDNRGAGRTDVSDREEYTIRMMADDTAGLMDALGIRRAHVLGISMGGMIAQELAINHPQKVEKLVLASTFCGGPKAVPIPGEAAAMVTEIMGLLSQKGGWDREVASKLLPFIFTEEFMRENPGVVEVAIDLLLTAPTPPEGIVKQVSAILSFDCLRQASLHKGPHPRPGGEEGQVHTPRERRGDGEAHPRGQAGLLREVRPRASGGDRGGHQHGAGVPLPPKIKNLISS
jgi:3-oxoadipate enol-lactonase